MTNSLNPERCMSCSPSWRWIGKSVQKRRRLEAPQVYLASMRVGMLPRVSEINVLGFASCSRSQTKLSWTAPGRRLEDVDISRKILGGQGFKKKAKYYLLSFSTSVSSNGFCERHPLLPSVFRCFPRPQYTHCRNHCVFLEGASKTWTPLAKSLGRHGSAKKT